MQYSNCAWLPGKKKAKEKGPAIHEEGAWAIIVISSAILKHTLTIKQKVIHKKKKNTLIYLRDYFESLFFPSDRLMKRVSVLDLIILHKEGGKKYTAQSHVLAWVWEYWLYPPQESGKIPRHGCSFFVPCSSIANKHCLLLFSHKNLRV